jgi:S1-C subfamily serine protease
MKMGHISKIQDQLQKLGLKQGTMEATPQELPAMNGGAVTTKQIVAVFTPQALPPRMTDGLGCRYYWVGIELHKIDGRITVREVTANSEAALCGVMSGDILTEVASEIVDHDRSIATALYSNLKVQRSGPLELKFDRRAIDRQPIQTMLPGSGPMGYPPGGRIEMEAYCG